MIFKHTLALHVADCKAAPISLGRQRTGCRGRRIRRARLARDAVVRGRRIRRARLGAGRCRPREAHSASATWRGTLSSAGGAFGERDLARDAVVRERRIRRARLGAGRCRPRAANGFARRFYLEHPRGPVPRRVCRRCRDEPYSFGE
jgi:hypothetical protein